MVEQEKRILIVDDNPEIHGDFSKVLLRKQQVNNELSELASIFDDGNSAKDETSTVQIDSAFQGDDAVEKVRQSIENGTPYSLAFVDVRMPPGLDGIETTRLIWELDPEIQIVICSAYSDYSWEDIVKKLQYSDRFLILKKPFESIEVRQLAAALHQRWVEARSDVLTGLINRRVFLSGLNRQVRIARDEQSDLSCVMIDLDFFKRINDQHGHQVGDELLTEVAGLLSSLCREGDHVCRYGGEEFCVWLRGANEDAAAEWAERTRERLISEPITAGDVSLNVTASFGIASADAEIADSTVLLGRADHALRVAKELGRDCVTKYSQVAALDEVPVAKVRDLFQTVDTAQLMRPPHSIARNATLSDAASILIHHNVISAPVVDEDGKLVGVLNESDLLQMFSDQQKDCLVVSDAMRASVVGFPENTPLQEIFDFLVRVSIPQVVIVRNSQPRGVIGRKALLEWLCSVGFGDSAPGDSTPTIAPADVAGCLPMVGSQASTQ